MAVLRDLLLLVLNKLLLTLLWETACHHLSLLDVLLRLLLGALLLLTLVSLLLLLGALSLLTLIPLLLLLLSALLLLTLVSLLLLLLRSMLLLRLWLGLGAWLLRLGLGLRLLLSMLFLVLLRLCLAVGRDAHSCKQHGTDDSRRCPPLPRIDIHGIPPW